MQKDLMDDSSSESEKEDDNNLSSIFNDPYATTYITNDGKKRWRCEWCKKDFALWNATKAMYHLIQKRKVDIAPCQAQIDDVSKKRYRELYYKKKKRSDSVARKRDLIDTSIDATNIRGAVSLESAKQKRRKVSSTSSLSSTNKTSNGGTITTSPTESKKELYQMKIYGGPNPNADTKLTMAIADFIHSCGLPFRIASHPKFRKLIQLARMTGSKFKFPSRNQIATELLDVNYDSYMETVKETLLTDINTFGISFYGDGATVRRMPLINIMASGAYIHTAVMEIVNCTKHLENGGKKDAKYISSLFRPHIDDFENLHPHSVDYCTFDGAANVQKAGEALSAFYPRIVCTHGTEHVLSLFFGDCFKSKVLALFVNLSRKIYAVFGSGSMHAPYAIFQKYSRVYNSGKNIGLIRAAQTRMGGEAIALQRLLRLKEPLQQTVDSTDFIKLKVTF
jgi:hypothetical protein